ncbi:hypothetical protein CMK18_23160 [Candidatus Poribacteria bacterium]|nr:hypothetical protein [Candidatus Poribacteria bacterium]
MAVRRQAYEWRNVIPCYNDSPLYYDLSESYVVGHPVLDCNPYVAPEANPTNLSTPPSNNYVDNLNQNIAVPLIKGGYPIGLFTGGFGNNTKTSAHVLANQMVIIDSLSCWPPDANLNVFVDENYYYDAPDYSAINGLSGYTVPFPEPNYANIFTVESFKEGIDPPIYIMPGSTWGVFITFAELTAADGSTLLGTGQQARNTTISAPFARNTLPTWEGKADGAPPNTWNVPGGVGYKKDLQEQDIARGFVKYLLIDGADFLVAKKMIDIGIPVTEKNLQEFKQNLTRWQLRTDIHEGDLDEELIRETGMTTRRSALP